MSDKCINVNKMSIVNVPVMPKMYSAIQLSLAGAMNLKIILNLVIINDWQGL